MANLFVNWKTTMSGILSIIGGISAIWFGLKAEGGLSQEVLISGAGLILTGIGLIFARDADKSTEDQNP